MLNIFLQSPYSIYNITLPVFSQSRVRTCVEPSIVDQTRHFKKKAKKKEPVSQGSEGCNSAPMFRFCINV